MVAAVRKADSKLVFIPMVFVLLRMWGTLEFFYTIALPKLPAYEDGPKVCIHSNYYHGLVFLGVMQVSQKKIVIVIIVTVYKVKEQNH